MIQLMTTTAGGASKLRDLLRYRDLLLMLTWRDIRIKYKQSVLGVGWAILMPLIIVFAGIVVRAAFSIASGDEIERSAIANVAIRAVPWAFLVSAMRFATTCLIGNPNLVTKIYFPKVVMPIAAVLSQLFDFLVASAALICVLPLLGVTLRSSMLWTPPLLLLLLCYGFGAGILLSAASLFFRDVKYIVEIVLTFAIFFTPIFYDASTLGKWEGVLMLNPVAPIFEALAASLLGTPMCSAGWLIYSSGIALGLLATSIAIFSRLEKYFAECI